MKKTVGVFGVCLSLLPTAWADLTIVEKTFEGGEEYTAKKYYSNNKYKCASFYEGAVESVNMMDFSKMTFTEIDVAEKVYCVFDCSKLKPVLDENLAGKGPTVVKLAGEQEIIAGLKADKYLVKFNENAEMAVWVSTGDRIDNHSNAILLEAFDWFYDEMPEGWGEFSEDYLSPYGKLKNSGLVLKSVRPYGLDKEATMVVTSIDKKSIPASVFELPAGFREVSVEELYGEGTGISDCIELLQDKYPTQAPDVSTPVSTMVEYLGLLHAGPTIKALFPLTAETAIEDAKDITEDEAEMAWVFMRASFNESAITDVAFEIEGSKCVFTFKGTSQGGMFSMGDEDVAEASSVSIVVNMAQEDGAWKVLDISASHTSGDDVEEELKSPPEDTAAILRRGVAEDPVAGTVHGEEFIVEDAYIEDGRLTLRRGADFFVDYAVIVHLELEEGEEVPESRQYLVSKDGQHEDASVWLKWKVEGETFPKTDMSPDDMTMVLKLGKETTRGILPGRIYLKVPGEYETEIEGAFSAEIRGFRLIDGKPDLSADDFKTLDHILKTYLASKRPGKEVDASHYSGSTMYDSYSGPREGVTKTASACFKCQVGASEMYLKVRFVKKSGEWQMVYLMKGSQLLAAHPLDPPLGSSAKATVVASLALEKQLGSVPGLTVVTPSGLSVVNDNARKQRTVKFKYKINEGEPAEAKCLLKRVGDQWSFIRMLGDEEPEAVNHEQWQEEVAKVAAALAVDNPGMKRELSNAEPGVLNLAGDKGITNIISLGGVSLYKLDLGDTGIEDISPLQGLALQNLSVWATSVNDISAVKGMPLEHLTIGHCPVSDISMLKGMKLESLSMTGTKAADISVLRGMPLTVIDLNDARVDDIAPLEGAPLKVLMMNGLKVEEISVLEGMPLEKLWMGRTQVKDVGVLKGMPLKELWIQNTEVDDVSVLATCSKLELLILNRGCSGVEQLRNLPNLKRIGYQYGEMKPAEEFWQDYDVQAAR
jgi:hypothetical protein